MAKFIRETFYEENMHDELDPKLGSTANLNEDLVKRITHSKPFLKDIKKVRKDLGIPKLGEKDDFIDGEVEYGFKTYDASDSKWFLDNIMPVKSKLKEFHEKIDEIIQIHNLPINFREWLKDYILWGNPDYVPRYPIAYGREFFTNPVPTNIRLTTEEKKFYKSKFREICKLPKTGKIPKKFMPVYKKFINYLSKNKNTNRKQKNLDVGLKILKEHGKKYEEYDYTIKKTIKSKTIYADMVEKMHSRRELKNLFIVNQKVQKFRKIKQRAKKSLDKKDEN